MKSVLWRVAKFLSYIEEARCPKVNLRNILPQSGTFLRDTLPICQGEVTGNRWRKKILKWRVRREFRPMDIVTELLLFHLSISGELRACVRARDGSVFVFRSSSLLLPAVSNDSTVGTVPTLWVWKPRIMVRCPLKADSHITCCAHAFLLPFHAAKGFECVVLV